MDKNGREPKGLDRLRIPIDVTAEAMTWLAICTNLDIALKHPGNTGPSREIIQTFTRMMREKLEEVLGAGWASGLDLPPHKEKP